MITPFTPAIRNTNKPRILIVDDNPRFSQRAHLTLQQSGHYVVCEENDAAAHWRRRVVSGRILSSWILSCPGLVELKWPRRSNRIGRCTECPLYS